MSLSELGTSDQLVGSADVMNQAPWLGTFVQFFISWSVIIGFLMYYFSYLCSLVFLSNKEFFYSVNEIKKNGDGGDKRLNIKSFMKAFTSSSNGGEVKKKLTGIDNIVIFVMMLAPNFMAYSMYANVDKGSGGEAKEGEKFTYTDTMGQFFLKSLPDSVLILFILGMALSGLLLQILFQLSDVLTVQAHRFASVNLNVWAESLADKVRTEFEFGSYQTTAGNMADKVARAIMVQARAQVPEMSDDEQESCRQAIETWVRDNFVNPESPYEVIKLVELYEKRYGNQVKDLRWTSESGKSKLMKSHLDAYDYPLQTGFTVDVRFSGQAYQNVSAVFDMKHGLPVDVVFTQPYANIYVNFDLSKIRTTAGSKTESEPTGVPLDGFGS